MRYLKFNLILFFALMFSVLFVSKAYASDTFNFKIQNDVSTFISGNTTTANVDEANRRITLPKMPLTDLVKFAPDGSPNYAVLTNDGLKQYVFDGTKEVLLNSLSIPITDPLSMAVSQDPNGYTSFSIATVNSANNTFDIKNYQNNGISMAENPALKISGLQSVYSLTNTTNGLAVLTDKDMKLFVPGDSGMVEIPQLGIQNVQDPIALASSSDRYNVAILKKDKAEYYEFNGTSLMDIPAMSVTIDPTLKNPKAIAINGNTTSILYDSQVSSYQFNPATQQMEYHDMLSITNGLVKPQAFAFRKNTNDVVVIDEVDSVNKKYRAKYFMFDGTKMVEAQSLENDIDNFSTGDRYMQNAVVVSNVLLSQYDYVDSIRVRAYTETPKGTSITFYVANSGNDETSANWQPAWKVENVNGTSLVYKYISLNYQEYGTPDQAYPSFDSKPFPTNTTSYTNSDVNVTTDANGQLNLNVPPSPDSQLINLWTVIPIADKAAAKLSGDYKKVRIKAVLETSDLNVTPMIFAPIGTNNTNAIQNADDTAIRVEAGTAPNTPNLNPIDPGNGDPLYPPVDGWIYTTTPTITWQYSDTSGSAQTASQIIALAKDNTGNWNIAYNSLRVDGGAGSLPSFKIPTSDKPDVNGPLYQANSYQFAVFVRTWNAQDIASVFSQGIQFKVLAFERPRISHIVNSPSTINPTLNDPTTHFMILPVMTKDQLATTKAGAQVTLLLDSVGPILSDPKVIPKFYISVNGTDYEMNLGSCKSLNLPGDTSNNRWTLNFWTNAPITTIPNDTLVKAKFIGTGVVGGTTTYYLPPVADGVIKTSDTIYTDWQVTLQGSDKIN